MTGLNEALVNLEKGIKITEKLIAIGQQVLSLPLANMSARLKLAIDTLKATEEVSECLSSKARYALKYGKNPETKQTWSSSTVTSLQKRVVEMYEDIAADCRVVRSHIKSVSTT